MKVAHFPAGFAEDTATYIGLLVDALRSEGVDALTNVPLAIGNIVAEEVDVIHLHWLEYIVQSDPARWTGPVRSLIRTGRFLALLRSVKRRQVAIVWTAHNLRPHEQRWRIVDYLLAAGTCHFADAVIVHSKYASERLATALHSRQKIVVIEHGNYIEAFPGYCVSPPPELGPDHTFTFLCFGQIRAYKQLPEVARSFRAMPHPHLRLIIAGKPVSHEELTRVLEAVGDDPRIEVDARTIPAKEVSELHNRADAAILAYRDVFSSGALLLALSYGLPVVAPATGTATELVQPPGIEPFAGGDLSNALNRILTGDQQARRTAALAAAKAHPWSAVGRATAHLYRSVTRS
jgi:beta-1,4-mannosyltransferase